MEVREASSSDATGIAAIYNHYIVKSTITIEEQAVSDSEMTGRIEDGKATTLPWYVAEQQDLIIGFAYATPWKSRSAYRFSCEVTIYVAAGFARAGVGSSLYRRLLPKLASRGFHTVLAGIALPNESSIALHERFGFQKVAISFRLDSKNNTG